MSSTPGSSTGAAGAVAGAGLAAGGAFDFLRWRWAATISENFSSKPTLSRSYDDVNVPEFAGTPDNPPHSSGPHGSTKDLQWPYAAWGATVVLAGHDHTYERIVKDGITFLVNGLGGERPYPFKRPLVEGSLIHYDKQNGALKITIDETAAVFEFVTDGGTTIDRFTVPPSYR